MGLDEQESLRTMLRHTVEAEELRQTLEAMGLEATYANAIQFQMVKKAAGGDLSAAKYLREYLAEEPLMEELPDLQSLSTAQLRIMAAKTAEDGGA